MPSTTLQGLALLVDGQVIGESSTVIHDAASMRWAADGDITLADNSALADQLGSCKASAVVTSADFPPTTTPRLVVEDVHEAFARIVLHLRPRRTAKPIGRSPRAYIAPTARLADDVQVHPLAMIGENVRIGRSSVIHSGVQILGDCTIGAQVTLYPNVVLYEGTVVGDRSTLHAGCVIGANGFGYRVVDGKHQRAAQLGNVEIGPDVEIGAGTTIDRGTYDATVIGAGTKIDNQVMIGHNCHIGRHNLLCSQVGIAGSCTTGDYVVMAGQVGLSDHLQIGDRAILGAKAGLMNDVPADSVYIGVPATPEREQWKMWGHVRQLPKLRQQLKKLLRQVEQLTASTDTESEEMAAASSCLERDIA